VLALAIVSGLFGPISLERSETLALELLAWVTRANVAALEADPAIPSLETARPRYRPGLDRGETWLGLPAAAQRRVLDCEDLACWRAAELRRGGEDAWPALVRLPHNAYHVVVRRADGSHEDVAERFR
jgi:hypothetical protein